jgi:hypothetical protein
MRLNVDRQASIAAWLSVQDIRRDRTPLSIWSTRSGQRNCPKLACVSLSVIARTEDGRPHLRRQTTKPPVLSWFHGLNCSSPMALALLERISFGGNDHGVISRLCSPVRGDNGLSLKRLKWGNMRATGVRSWKVDRLIF